MDHCQIKLLAEGSSKATIDGIRTRNLPIARLTPYPLGYQALIDNDDNDINLCDFGIHFHLRKKHRQSQQNLKPPQFLA